VRLIGLALISLFVLITLRISGQDKDSLLLIINTEENDSVRFNATIEFANLIADDYPDSSLILLQEVELQLPGEGFNVNKVRVLLAKARLFTDVAQYPESLKNLYEAKRLLESFDNLENDTLVLSYYLKLMSDIGVLFIYTEKYEDAQTYFQAGLDYLNQLGADPSVEMFKKELFRFNLNFGAVYARARDFDKAELYFTKAMQYLDESNFLTTATLLNNLSIIAREKKELDKAFDLVTQAMKIWDENNYKRGLVQSYNNLANCYFDKNDVENAHRYYKKAFEISRDNGFGNSAIISLEQLSRTYASKGEYEKAYDRYIQFKSWSDSLLNLEKVRLVTQLELQDKFEQRMIQTRLLQQKKEVEQKRRELIYTLIIGSVIMGLIILILLYSLQRSKTKRLGLASEKNELERKSLELEKNNLEEELEFKNKELATNVMYMVRKNELITQIAEKLVKSKLDFKKENQKHIEEIIRDLQSTTDQDIWKEFEIRFQQVHNEFYEKLNERFPNLSANEKKLSAFLRLNMSTKEISAITYQSINSITVARSRLRKKLDLDTDENLISFLENL